MRKICFVFLIFLLTDSIHAQMDTAKSKQLSEVVVTGQYHPQSAKNAVYQVRVIDNQQIVLSGATTIQQILNTQLGFRFSNDNTLGTTDVELMGMSGRNVKILLDGVPLIDRGDARESLSQIDINSIQRIEIVEGPMSVIYGSDALAGVINLISKKTGSDNLSVRAKVQEETAGSEYYPFSYKGVHLQNLGIAGQKDKWGFSAAGTHNDMQGFGGDDWGRGKSWKPKEQWLGNGIIKYGDNHFNIYYRLDALHEIITSKGAINLNTYKAVDQQYISDRYMHQLQEEWRINEKMQLNGVASFTDYKRRTKSTRHDFTDGSEELTTGAGEQDVAKVTSWMIRPLWQYKASSKLSIQSGIDINHEAASGERISGTPEINDYAFFISSEIKPVTVVNIRPGLRFIKNSVYDAPPVIPSINTKFALSNTLDLRLAYAYGFRSPALRELYFTFHDANHDIDGNPDLKAEHSNSFNGQLAWTPAIVNHLQFTSTIGGFYNFFSNQIALAQSADDASLYTYFNVEKFKTTGITWDNKINYKALYATVGLAYIGRYNTLSSDESYDADDLPAFMWAPEVNANMMYPVKSINTTFALFYKFTGKRQGYEVETTNTGNEVHLTEIEAYHWADFTVTKPLFTYFSLTAGVKNIFNVTDLNNTAQGSGEAHSTNGPLPLSYGRSYFIGLSFQWKQ